jgi:hypothetical protein
VEKPADLKAAIQRRADAVKGGQAAILAVALER